MKLHGVEKQRYTGYELFSKDSYLSRDIKNDFEILYLLE
jgi:hypothetical protein